MGGCCAIEPTKRKAAPLEQQVRYVITELTWTLFRQWDRSTESGFSIAAGSSLIS